MLVAIPPVNGPCALWVSQPEMSICTASTPMSARINAAVDRSAAANVPVG